MAVAAKQTSTQVKVNPYMMKAQELLEEAEAARTINERTRFIELADRYIELAKLA